LGRETERPREIRGDLDDEQPLGIGTGASELRHGPAGMQREAAPALLVGRRGDGRHGARGLRLEKRLEAAKVGGDEAQVLALVAKRPLDGSEEPRGSGRSGA
jgi:hypothetical protein